MAFRPVKHYLAALLVLLALYCCGTASAAATASQKNVTLSFLSGFHNKFPAQLGSWTGTDYCSWSGISCNSDDYVTVNLAGKGLNGYLPDFNTDETLITSLDISNNGNMKGNFPSSWASLKALQTLSLAHTGLYGAIPDAWNGMRSLRDVTITNTKACQGLPNWDNMPVLSTVDFSNNNMGGTLANSWSSIVSLTSLKISGNNFCGCEPDTWKTVTVLHNAVSSLGVGSANCATSNQCRGSNFQCDAKNGSNGSIGVVSTVIAVVSVACALLSVLAL